MTAFPAPAPKIGDAGEYLPFARKHLAQETGPTLQDGVTLDDLWPEPDWEQLVAGGMPVQVAAEVAMMRDGLATKPRGGIGRSIITEQQWNAGYRQAVPIIRDLLMASVGPGDALKLNKSLQKHLGLTSANVSSYPTAETLTKEIIIYWAAGRGTSKLRHPGNKTLRQSYLAMYLPKLGWPASDANLKTSIVPCQLTDKTWRAAKIEGNKFFFCDVEPIATEEQAIAAAIRFAGTVQTGEAIPNRPTQDKSLVRQGPDYRNGDDISPERLMAEFGVRAVQFGNAMSQPERQIWLNQTFDALADLSDVLKWPRRWLGLRQKTNNESLGLAFGARGTGAAQAHFEPALYALNLTRGKGAGALAHEWGHAMDSRIGRNVAGRFMSESFWCVDDMLGELSPKYRGLYDLVKEIMGRCKDPNSNYWKQSARVAATRRAGKYWIEAVELFARGFEAYIQDALLEQGRISPWLVHGTLEQDYDLAVVAACPYPVGQERTELNSLYRNLVETMGSRESQ